MMIFYGFLWFNLEICLMSKYVKIKFVYNFSCYFVRNIGMKILVLFIEVIV